MTDAQKHLQLDAGNTCLKWRLVSGSQTIDSGRIDNKKNWQDELSAIVTTAGGISAAAISMVSGADRLERLQQILRDIAGIEPIVARTQKQCAGVTVIYKKVEMLGVDRWLAMLAAHNSHPDNIKVVVDCGTAMTIDVVDSEGLHLGGYIVPGLRLMKESLAINTAELETVEHPAHATELGDITMDCINHGVLAMSVAMVDEVCARYRNAVLYITGGDAPQLLDHLKSQHQRVYVPDLVMDGLGIISQHR
ncbi:hypothetical protein EOPP23_08385 [Endozoicomonas sp. OPT23]|uniref:type III pantothenate kinase n=1 Tax=Endozoicomonas sp. OPT23 TaxID=2072845 RepID=UPI00129AA767|nr:type III pantothenate kinase [Endozoicomonas sp. OPT23]MRI32998.1 hypothetical protein [Endozoicomonas sp. OPT23]